MVKVKISTMSSICFICHFCCQPLKLIQSTETSGLDLSQEPSALKLPSAQQELGDTPEEGSASRMETDIEEFQDRASGWTTPGNGEMSGDGPSNFILFGKLASGRTLSSIQRATKGLCDILSSEEELYHPLCQDCTNSIEAAGHPAQDLRI
uniref:Uncharacterized protein n=1 Tax=Myotis myotis TaxID=51298 RepID=A0A7J7THW0_MYOMY|nr:hypothetical protein mMyoMyo1_001439 [Myotis myotis]